MLWGVTLIPLYPEPQMRFLDLVSDFVWIVLFLAGIYSVASGLRCYVAATRDEARKIDHYRPNWTETMWLLLLLTAFARRLLDWWGF
jgi:hypothetical protein